MILRRANDYRNVVGNISKPSIGILALQGDVELHKKCLKNFNIEPRTVKLPEHLESLDGLIIPGGESTALLKLARPIGMLEALTSFAAAGGNIFATCAGAILVAKKVTSPAQPSLGLIDIEIKRNAYGRQLQSAEAVGLADSLLEKASLKMVFIRAPKIMSVGKGVKVLGWHEENPVLVEEKNILVATFHPELTDDDTLYRYWLENIK